MKSKIIFYLIVCSFTMRSAEYVYFSQSGQDRFVHEHCFNGVRNGFFVDIGAHDGITISNTYFFEKYLGWRGVCVEPLPTVFELLKKNRTALCVNGCISDHSGQAIFLKITGYAEMLSGLVEKYDLPHRARIMREVTTHGDRMEFIEMICYSFHDLMQQHSVSHINYLSIDTEGGELDIIKSIDFDDIIIDVITVEDNYDDHQITEYLLSKDYQLIGSTSDDLIFQRKELVSI